MVKAIRKKPVFLFFAAVWLGLLLAPKALQAYMPTDDGLRRTESEHFVYIYQAALEDRIPKLVRDCEDAWELLTPIFQWTPREKPVVLFSDAHDVHNGWATVFPRPTMMIYAAEASPGSTIYEPGDPIRRTVFHEFTHLLSMDPQFGFDGALHRIFGRVLSASGDPLSALITFLAMPPGAVVPTWFAEGLAIWAETEMAGPGRGRSTLVDMIFRAAAAEDRLLPPTRWNLNRPEWPFGAAAYIYGMKMVQYAHEMYGLAEEERNVAGDLSISAADSFPFFFSGRAYPVTGQTFSQLAWETIEYEEARQKERIRQLEAHPLTGFERLTPPDLQVHHPRFDHTGRRIFFSGAREEHRDTLYLYDAGKGGESLHRLDGARADGPFSGLAPASDHSVFYYTRLESPRREKRISQLHRYDVSANRSRKVTGRGRYRFPAIRPDHSKIAAVRAEGGSQRLVEVPPEKAGDRASERILLRAPASVTLADPVYSPDGSSLVYIRADEKTSQIRRLDPESLRDSLLLEWQAIIASPVFHPEGAGMVFVSDKNGVYNLYRMKYCSDSEPVAITHTLGGVFQPDFSPDGRKLAVSAYDADGYHLAIIDYKAETPGIEPGALPKIGPAWASLEQNRKQREAVEKRDEKPEMAPPDTYRPYREVRPDYWTPWLDASFDGVRGGALSRFSDPVNRHALMLKGGFETAHNTPLASVVYDYSRFEPIFTFYGFHDQTRYYNLLEDAAGVFHDYDEEAGGLGAALTFPFDRADRSVHLSLGCQWNRSRAITETSEIFEENERIGGLDLFEGSTAAAWARLRYFSGTAFRRSHSVEDGRLLSVAVERTDEDFGGDLSQTRMLGAWSEYVKLPWFTNHVLKMEGHYGASTGDRTAQGAFGLGGFSPGIAGTTPGMPRSLGLRGYEQNTQVGARIVKAGAAYRFPIFPFYRGAGATFPLYMHQIFGEVFYEGGRVTGGEPPARNRNEWISACGLEVNFSLTILRLVDIAPGIGIAYAPDRKYRERADNGDVADDERWQYYITLKSVINF